MNRNIGGYPLPTAFFPSLTYLWFVQCRWLGSLSRCERMVLPLVEVVAPASQLWPFAFLSSSLQNLTEALLLTANISSHPQAPEVYSNDPCCRQVLLVCTVAWCRVCHVLQGHVWLCPKPGDQTPDFLSSCCSCSWRSSFPAQLATSSATLKAPPLNRNCLSL